MENLSELNSNLYRILDTIQREWQIDIPLPNVVENVGECIHLLGVKGRIPVSIEDVIDNYKIKKPCYVSEVYSIEDVNGLLYDYKYDRGYYFFNTTNKIAIINAYSINVDDNGYPVIETEKQYMACLWYCIYKHYLISFINGTIEANKLQYIENKKNTYFLQASVEKTVVLNDMQKITERLHTTFFPKKLIYANK